MIYWIIYFALKPSLLNFFSQRKVAKIKRKKKLLYSPPICTPFMLFPLSPVKLHEKVIILSFIIYYKFDFIRNVNILFQDKKKNKAFGKPLKEEQAKTAIKNFEAVVKYCEYPM